MTTFNAEIPLSLSGYNRLANHLELVLKFVFILDLTFNIAFVSPLILISGLGTLKDIMALIQLPEFRTVHLLEETKLCIKL